MGKIKNKNNTIKKLDEASAIKNNKKLDNESTIIIKNLEKESEFKKRKK